MMTGEIIVVDAGEQLPASSTYNVTDLEASIWAESSVRTPVFETVYRLVEADQPPRTLNTDGSWNYNVRLGFWVHDDNGWGYSFMRLIPGLFTIQPGDTVTYWMTDAHAHAIGINTTIAPYPAWFGVPPTPSGSNYYPGQVLNGGIIEPGPRSPDIGGSYTVRFPVPGTYTVVCWLHFLTTGMGGQLTVASSPTAGETTTINFNFAGLLSNSCNPN